MSTVLLLHDFRRRPLDAPRFQPPRDAFTKFLLHPRGLGGEVPLGAEAVERLRGGIFNDVLVGNAGKNVVEDLLELLI